VRCVCLEAVFTAQWTAQLLRLLFESGVLFAK
jgi:hypothetical protein